MDIDSHLFKQAEEYYSQEPHCNACEDSGVFFDFLGRSADCDCGAEPGYCRSGGYGTGSTEQTSNDVQF